MIVSALELPDASGLELLHELPRRGSSVPTIIVSMHDEPLYAERALRGCLQTLGTSPGGRSAAYVRSRGSTGPGPAFTAALRACARDRTLRGLRLARHALATAFNCWTPLEIADVRRRADTGCTP